MPVPVSVIGKTGDDMNVGVEHQLSCGAFIIHADIYSVRVQRGFHYRSELVYCFHQSGKIFARNIVNIFDVCFWNDQEVSVIHGVDIKKRIRRIVLVHLLGGDLSTDDLAKKTVVHGMQLLREYARYFVLVDKFLKNTVHECSLCRRQIVGNIFFDARDFVGAHLFNVIGALRIRVRVNGHVDEFNDPFDKDSRKLFRSLSCEESALQIRDLFFSDAFGDAGSEE